MSITSRISSMEEHVTNAYNGLQGLGADLTNLDKNIENISMVLDDIYDSMPQVSGEGSSLTLDDTRVGKIKSTLKGNTSQTGTPTPSSPIPVNVVSGDNEIIVNSKNQLETYNVSGTFNGVSYTLQDGVLTLNGTCTSTGAVVGLGIFRQIKGINYKWTYVYESGSCTDYGGGLFMSATPTGTGSAGYGSGFRTSQSRTVGTFNNGEEHTYYLYMTINKNSTFTNYKIKPLIVQGDEYSYDFEPYIGNTYNIDLRTSKNLFNKDTIINGKVLASNGALNDASGFVVGDYIQVKPSTQYTISFDYTAKEYLRIGYYQKDKTFIERPFSGDRPWTITTPSNCYYIRICNPDNYTNVQCEGGNQQTTYEPYNSIELCKIGNYQDYFYKDSDKWYLHKEIGKVVLNGSEAWVTGQYGTNSYNLAKNDLLYSTDIAVILSNLFKGVSYNDRITGNDIVYHDFNENKIYIRNTTYTSLADFKTMLGSTNMIAYYILATPTNTEITYQPLIDQLNELELAQSKENQTNISQVNNDLPFIISASALKEWSV